jgi:ABC-2 type transport system permease protein
MINDTIAIYKKEMKTYFNSPIAFIIIAVFLIVTNWLFMDYGDYPFFAINIADIRNLFDYASIILLIVAPAISMRMVAEEKYTGTLELLVTMPISDASIILGKYFATLAIFFLILLGTLVTPITISTIGDMDLGIILSSYVGFFLLGASYLAIGMAASSFTKNQIIAYIAGMVVIAIFFLMNGISSGSGFWGALFENLSIRYHYQNFFRGIIDSRDLLYFVSLIAVSLMISTAGLSDRKYR